MPIRPASEVSEKPKTEEPVYTDVGDEGAFDFDPKKIERASVIQNESPESLCSISADFYTRTGSRIMVTLRGPHPSYVIDVLIDTVLYLENKLNIKMEVSQTKSQKPEQEQHQVVEESGGRIVVDSGTATLHKIDVDLDGKVLFSVGKFEFPFKDSRKHEIVAELFEESLGFTEDHFSKPVRYTPEDWKPDTLVVDWEKVKKDGKNYYNVLKVHKA